MNNYPLIQAWLFGAGLLLLSGAALAQDGPISQLGQQQYQDCLALSARAPVQAFENAIRWRDEGGGLPARHCMALALVGSERYREAATDLETIAEDLRIGEGVSEDLAIERGDASMIAEIYAQAGNVWMLADEPMMAYQAFSQGLSEAPLQSAERPELLIDRARASAMAGDFELAIEDLNSARRMKPRRVDILVFRASAHRALENYAAADADLYTGLMIEPENREALLEQGNLKLAQDDIDGARQAWLSVVRLYPESAAADAARINIERIDLDAGGDTPDN